MENLSNQELLQINGGESGDLLHDIAYGAGYAYQSLSDWWDDFSYAVGRQGILGGNAPL